MGSKPTAAAGCQKRHPCRHFPIPHPRFGARRPGARCDHREMTNSAIPEAQLLGRKTFTHADQQAFAAASHDVNPMHVDAVAARRLLSGRQVVHGIHTLIHLLDLWQAPASIGPLRVECNFANPVNVGDAVVFTQSNGTDGKTTLTATVDGLACTEVVVAALTADARGAAPVVLDPSGTLPRRTLGGLTAPLDEAPGSQVGSVIVLDAWADTLTASFPRAAALLGSAGLSAVARLSYFVGMVCPGQHSVFSSVRFTTGAAGTGLELAVRKFDPRFKLFTVTFGGAVEGELRAFLRPPPQPQPGAAEVAQQVGAAEFTGRRALVIGGSRGLGETTAKIIAAGGGEVVISYAQGRDDAAAVAADINAQGRGRCSLVPLDLGRDFEGVPDIAPAMLDAVYFFATPRIYAKRNTVFDRTAFESFVDFYLHRFHQLCLWLDQTERTRPARVYLPSTVFITERPKGMTEYAMAKAAAELLADDLNRSLHNVRIVHTRLPRLATDQTASILKVEVGSNLDAMLPVVRQVMASSAD